jgi:hypothetical protein
MDQRWTAVLKPVPLWITNGKQEGAPKVVVCGIEYVYIA